MIRLLEKRIHFLPIKTRMPFRYGIATMTDLPFAFVFLKFQFGDSSTDTRWGVASDLLPPRWFKKDPGQSPDDEITELKRVINNALTLARDEEADTPFSFWHSLYQNQLAWAAEEKIPALLANFGTTFVERALLHAFTSYRGTPLHKLLRNGELGLDLEKLHPELASQKAADLLPENPLYRIQVRHTVGFGDPLTEREVTSDNRVSDSLPQSLETAIRSYGLTQFKVKINGQLDEDLDRLKRLSEILEEYCPSGYSLSLDGNEQFSDWQQFSDFWTTAQAISQLQPLLERVIFIEQPLSRGSALDTGGIGTLPDGTQTPPIIIDESDDGSASFRQALDCGYRGISHKNCKGVFKGIANRCLISYRNQSATTPLFMSGEDLCNIGPLALLQDMTLQSLLGNSSVERNGHHYFYGLSPFPAATQTLLAETHPELYQTNTDGVALLKIENGEIPTADLHEAPFGTRFSPEDLCNSLGFEPLE